MTLHFVLFGRLLPSLCLLFDFRVHLPIHQSIRFALVSSSMMLATLRNAADSMGKDVLGFTSSEIGCHSIRSACAMALCLAGYPEFTIMLICRWRSYSFLRYIRKQIQQFYSGISSRMIQLEHFFTIPRL